MSLTAKKPHRHDPKRAPGFNFTLAAVGCMAALVAALLVVNYLSQRSLVQANIDHIRHDLDDRARSIRYFLTEREADIRDLASSSTVLGFFSNRDLGMSMEYGLRASLNNVSRKLTDEGERSRLGGRNIYSTISLYDLDGSLLAQWPAAATKPPPLDETTRQRAADSVQLIHSVDGSGRFIAPVLRREKLYGFISGLVNFETIVAYKFGGTKNRVTLLFDDKTIYTPEKAVAAPVLSGKEQAVTLSSSMPAPAAERRSPDKYFSEVPGYQLILGLEEDKNHVNKQRTLLLLMIGLSVLSVTVMAIVLLTLRQGTRTLILETSLQESKKRQEESDNIISNFLDTLIVVDHDMKITRVNKATCQLLGFCEKELTSMRVQDLFHDSSELVNRAFSLESETPDSAAPSTMELRNVELCYRTRKGERLPMSFNIRALYDDDGTHIGVVAGAKDVSALRGALDKIEKQKNYIERLFDLLPNGLLAIDKNSHVVTHNSALGKICGKFGGQRCRGDIRQIPLGAAIAGLVDGGYYDNGQTIAIEGPDGLHHFRCTVAAVDEFNDISHLISVEDITAETRGAENRRLLSTVVDQMADSVLVTDNEGKILYVNPATLANSGYEKSDLLGRSPAEFVDSRTTETMLPAMLQAMKKGEGWKGLLWNQRKDDSIAEEEVTLSPVTDTSGKVAHFVAIKRDLTEMASLQRQLIHAQKMEAIGQLAAGIAHEINTPMQYIQNNVTFLKEAFDELQPALACDWKEGRTGRCDAEDVDTDFLLEEIPAGLEEVQEGVQRVVQIVSAMKDFSHPGSSEKLLTDINRTLASTITVSRNEWKYVAEVETDFDPDLPTILCYPEQLSQALLNLLVNGAHAIGAQIEAGAYTSGRISVATKQTGGCIQITVCDNGGGIADDIRERIFEPFFTTKEVGKGTGQGLAIVHDIVVEKHLGTIDAASPGDGTTTFTILLPIEGEEKNSAADTPG